MTADARAALTALIAALERHYEASGRRDGEDDPVVVASYEDLADAFETYDDALFAATGEMTPFEVVGEPIDDDDLDDEEDDEDDDLDEDQAPGPYAGLDDEDYDEDERD
ncbi:primosomal protein [Janibacter sp. GXQ6167]|uniref:primosomal protein n=1 Tax=Janibacter sp. GXQ6167 TaxID=3240791 RepID=UPI003524A3F4